ncbi:MAG: chemotaxis protein CheW [Myxococcales bacterium]|nr:chemotaxis protein CheW [Myxococcales bacterium]MCB9546608.1 chemotaxis protein CheW [Myxococcales bacterium]
MIHKPGCLVLTGGSLRLAVTAEQVVAVFPLDTITPLPGMPGWVLGLARHAGRMLVVVDPGLLAGRPAGGGGLAVHLAADVELALTVAGVEAASSPADQPGPSPASWLVPGVDDQQRVVYRLDVPGLVAAVRTPLKRSTAPAAAR